jgi:hypothetical protein
VSEDSERQLRQNTCCNDNLDRLSFLFLLLMRIDSERESKICENADSDDTKLSKQE